LFLGQRRFTVRAQDNRAQNMLETLVLINRLTPSSMVLHPWYREVT
jgi:hypothetical protein